MVLHNYNELLVKIKGAKKMTAVVAAAQDAHVLEAVFNVHSEGYIDYLLVGDKTKITEISAQCGVSVESGRIVGANDEQDAAEKAVALIRDKKGNLLIKGRMETSTLFRVVLNKERGIRTENTICNIAFHEMPQYYKLLGLTDGGVLPYPTLEQKAQLIKNSMVMFNALGYDNPKFAVLASSETVSEKLPETVDAAKLKEMAEKGEFGKCVVEGPISWDLMWIREAAEIKGYKSEVTGDADMLIAPNIACGNLVSKCMIFTAGAKMAGCAMGAQVPIVLTSRAASAEEKHWSILLAASSSQG